ncbi:nucleotide sugar dehydrogenase [Micrococcoides hystricis]|uniref:Nucleotide sugar dehydrogenase n=1 Tax=Micrococcoides hystricis TaxID=1572761 RepID=A0ABV6PD32_9MICC
MSVDHSPIALRERATHRHARKHSSPNGTSPRFDFDIAIVGLGYVGLPTALAHVHSGKRILGFEASSARVQAIKNHEVDLLPSDQQRLTEALEGENFELTLDPALLATAESVVICVPTPIDENAIPDLSILRSACETVVNHAVPGQILIATSTTYAGCTQDFLVKPLQDRGFTVGKNIFVAFSPERINPGVADFAIEDVPRVVGGFDQACQEKAAEVVGGYGGSIHAVDSLEVAEMSKLMENTFRAVNIAMANEFAEACRVLGLSVQDVIEAADSKPFGFMKFMPGPGVGGHCIPCDPHYLLWRMRKEHVRLPVIEQAMNSIAQRPTAAVERCGQLLAERGIALKDANVVVVGLSYKPDVADLRESPALQIMERLSSLAGRTTYVDRFFPDQVINNGREFVHFHEPVHGTPDLVFLNTVHRGTDLSWIPESAVVLDATYTHSKPNVYPL